MPASEIIDPAATGPTTTAKKPRRRKSDGAPPSTAAKPSRRRAATKAAVAIPPAAPAAVATETAGSDTQLIEPDATAVDLQAAAADEGEAAMAGPTMHDAGVAAAIGPTAVQADEGNAPGDPAPNPDPSAVDEPSRAHPASASPAFRAPRSHDKPAGKFSERVLAAAAARFADDPERAPLSRDQLDDLLVLLHEPGQDRSLRSSTYGYLERGMSMRHARKQIQRLREFVAERLA